MKSPPEIDRQWYAGGAYAGDGSKKIPVLKRPCAQEGTQKNSVEKDKAEKNKDANKDKKESKVGKPTDGQERNEEKKKSGNKVGLPLKRVGDGEAAKNGEGQAKGKKKTEKQEDLKQAKKTKGDPQPVKDTTQENINRFFGLAVAALLTASA